MHMMSKMAGLLGGAADSALKVQDVFAATTYTGTGATRNIVNNINLTGRGGLVWSKTRSAAASHELVDTVRGAYKGLRTNDTGGQVSYADVDQFNADGYRLGADVAGYANTSGRDYVSWCFAKAPKFFDIQTWTGDNTSPRNITHNLGIKPGLIIIKRLDTNSPWKVGVVANGAHLALNDYNIGTYYENGYQDAYTATDTSFQVATYTTNNDVNASGATYVAYLFAHDPSPTGIIQCGLYTRPRTIPIDLGWEPQFVMIKVTDLDSAYGGWGMFDTARPAGFVSGLDAPLLANDATAEGGTYNPSGSYDYISPDPTGIAMGSGTTLAGGPGGSNSYLYMAIRKGPM